MNEMLITKNVKLLMNEAMNLKTRCKWINKRLQNIRFAITRMKLLIQIIKIMRWMFIKED